MTIPIGPNLHRHRAKANLTQQQVAEELDVTIRTVQRWEAGTQNPPIPSLMRLAKLYDTTVPDFFAQGKTR